MNRRASLRTVFLFPAWAIAAAFLIVPMLIVVAYSFETRGAYGGVGPPWTFENYRRMIDPLYGWIVLRSFALAAAATAICLVMAYPLAFYIARAGNRRTLLLSLVMLPFWTSFLVRTYAWMFLLRDTGLVNTVLLSTGLIDEPLPLLYNQGAVVAGLVYGYLPFAVLPLYSRLERLDRSLLDAAADLGARPWQTFTHVLLPLSAPGLYVAAILVFISCLGAYLTPDLLGGGKSLMIGNLIQNQFTTARDWPFGSALSLGLMAMVMLVLMTVARRKGEWLL